MARARVVLPVCVLLAMGIRITALAGGLRGDDYVHAAMLRGDFPGPRAAWDLFRFAGPDAAANAPLVDFGYLPWWSAPDLTLSMFRPLASLLIAADHVVWGDALWLHHLHSLLWCGVAVLAVGLLYFRLLPAGPAALASLIFALDESHSLPATWLANRSTLIATTFGAMALLAYLAPRQGAHPRRQLLLSCSALAVALAAGEYAVCFFAYLVTFEALCPGAVGAGFGGAGAASIGGPSPQPRLRLLRLAVPLTAVLAYLALRAVSDHGVQHSGYYLSPTADPLGYLRQAPSRLALLLVELVFGLPAIEWIRFQGFMEVVWAHLDEATLRFFFVEHPALLPRTLGLLALAAFAGLAVLADRQLGGARKVLSLAAGGLVSLLPFASALPEDRLTMGPAVGVCGVLGAAAYALLVRLRSAPPAPEQPTAGHWRRRALLVGTLAAVLLIQLGVAPVRSHARVREFVKRARAERRWSLEAEMPKAPATAQRTRVYILGASEFTTAANLPFVRAHAGLSLPRSYRRLTGVRTAQDLKRVDERTLELTMLANVRGAMVGSLYRPGRAAIPAGHHIQLPGLAVEVQDSEAGHPTRVRFRFDRPLDGGDLLLLHATSRGLRAISLPAVGETIRLPPAGFGTATETEAHRR